MSFCSLLNPYIHKESLFTLIKVTNKSLQITTLGSYKPGCSEKISDKVNLKMINLFNKTINCEFKDYVC